MGDAVLDPEVSALLTLLNETFPAVHTLSGAEARAAVAARRQPVTNVDDVASAQDTSIDTDAGPLRIRVYQPHGDLEPARPLVVFFHGGGFVFCDLDTHDGFCRSLSKSTDAVVVSVGYRLAPEHPARAAADDAYVALCWSVANAAELGTDPTRVLVMGDSAGGNLAAVVCLLARDRGGPAVAGQVLLYPVIDPECATESYTRYGAGFFNTREAMQWYWRQYLGGTHLPDPAYVVAPLRADSHRDLPPAVVVTAGCDPLRDEGRRYAEELRSSGVPVISRSYPGLFHGFMTIPTLRAAESAREVLWADVNRLLGAA